MGWRRWAVLSILSGSLVGLFGLSMSEVHPIPGSDKPQRSVGEIWGEAQVCQSIHYFPGLSEVHLLLATYGRQNEGPVHFAIHTSLESPDPLITRTFDASDVEDNAFFSIEFPPIRGLDVRMLYFCLEAPQARPDNAITIWGAYDDVYPEGQAILEGVPGNRVVDLAFRLGYERTLGDRAEVLLLRMAVDRPSVFGERRLYVVLGLSYLVLVYVLFWCVLGRHEWDGSVDGGEG